MQYGGNQQQRILNMMMQARQQQQQVARSTGASMYGPGYPGLQRNAAPAGLQQQQQRLGMPQRPTVLPYVTSLTENDVLLGRGTPCGMFNVGALFFNLFLCLLVIFICSRITNISA